MGRVDPDHVTPVLFQEMVTDLSPSEHFEVLGGQNGEYFSCATSVVSVLRGFSAMAIATCFRFMISFLQLSFV